MSTWIVETLIATSLLMVAVLVLRGPVAKFAGPRAAYLLWLAPALRMVLPPLPDFWPQSLRPAEAATTAMESATYVLAITPSSPDMVAPGGSAAWPEVIPALWLGGAVLFIAWHLIAYARFRRAIEASARPVAEEGSIAISWSPVVPAPVALGIFDRRVVLPRHFSARFDGQEQALAMRHEIAHHQRGDLIANGFALGMLALHWFNPLAHIAYRAFRTDQEAACDATVLDQSGPEERHSYGTALYKSAAGSMPLAACAMRSNSQLKARLRRIAECRSATTRRAGGWMAATLVAMAVGGTASGTQSDPQPEASQSVESPRMLALNGVMLEADEAMREADIAAALADVEAHEADMEAAAAEADARSWARAHDTHWTSPPAPPAPPAAPEPLAAPEAPAPPAPLAPPVASVPAVPAIPAVPAVASSSCSDGHQRVVQQSISRDGKGQVDRLSIVMCIRKAAAHARLAHAEAMKALAEARAEIRADTTIPESVRRQIIEALDGRLSAMPIPPVPPLPVS